MFYVYILYAESIDHYYVGHTNDVIRRLEEHNNPKRYNKYTAKASGWVISAVIPSGEIRSEAVRIERYIKRKKSRKFIEQLISVSNNHAELAQLVRVPTRRD
ncbi:MAG: GIY-YIG nuclease family protein [Tenuifilaceae bacterium]